MTDATIINLERTLLVRLSEPKDEACPLEWPRIWGPCFQVYSPTINEAGLHSWILSIPTHLYTIDYVLAVAPLNSKKVWPIQR